MSMANTKPNDKLTLESATAGLAGRFMITVLIYFAIVKLAASFF